MTSERKRNSNRANARHSTGPTSTRGKDHSRFNALKSGVHAKSLLLPGESAQEALELHEAVTGPASTELLIAIWQDELARLIQQRSRLKQHEQTLLLRMHQHLEVLERKGLSAAIERLQNRVLEARLRSGATISFKAEEPAGSHNPRPITVGDVMADAALDPEFGPELMKVSRLLRRVMKDIRRARREIMRLQGDLEGDTAGAED